MLESLKMSANKRHHFVPQFHLRSFSKDDRLIHVASRDGKLCKLNVPIKGQCAKDRFYGHGTHETDLARIEGFLAEAFREAIDHAWGTRRNELANCDVDRLQVAFTIQRNRTPRAIRTHDEAASEFSMDMFLAYLSEESPELSDKLITAVQAGQAKVVFDPVETITFELSLVEHCVKCSSDLEFLILRNHTNRPFILGDAPAVMSNPYMWNAEGRSGLGFRSRGLLMTMPIDGRTAILFYDGEVYTPTHGTRQCVDVLNAADVGILNALQLHSSEVNVYFADETAEDYVRDLIRTHVPIYSSKAGEYVRYEPGQILIDGKPNTNPVGQIRDPRPPVVLKLSFLPVPRRPRNDKIFRANAPDEGPMLPEGPLSVSDDFVDDIRDALEFDPES